MRTDISAASERWPARLGLVLGLAAAVALVVVFRVPGGEPALGASIGFASVPTGELQVTPAGVFLETPDLRPGRSASARLVVTNLTGRSQALRLRAAGGGRDLDGILRVRVAAGPVPMFAGTLAALRGGTQTLALRPGERRQLTVRISIPTGADEVGARSAQVTLRPSSEPLEVR